MGSNCSVSGNHNTIIGKDCTVRGSDNPNISASASAAQQREKTAETMLLPIPRGKGRGLKVAGIQKLKQQRPLIGRFNPSQHQNNASAALERILAGLPRAAAVAPDCNLKATIYPPVSASSSSSSLIDKEEEEQHNNNNNNVGRCVICLDKRSVIMATPCNHLSMCNDCCDRMARMDVPHGKVSFCSICRAAVVSYIRIHIT